MSDYLQIPRWIDDHWVWELYDDSEEGKIFCGDVDGNWEQTDSMPDMENLERAMFDYITWVRDNGKDPLNEFSPRTKDTMRIAYYFKRIIGTLGDVFYGLDHVYTINLHNQATSTIKDPKLVPDYVYTALSSVEDWEIQDWAMRLQVPITWKNEDFKNAVIENLGGRLLSDVGTPFDVIFVLDVKVDRLERGIEEELKNLAAAAMPGAQARVTYWDLINSPVRYMDKVEFFVGDLQRLLEHKISKDRRAEVLAFQTKEEQIRALRMDARFHLLFMIDSITILPELRDLLLNFAQYGINWEATLNQWRKSQ